ncbi:MAG: arginyltransferase [Gemmataceae bacterium]|nr:arginyltransferase [Gemmataceae bacterium]
MTDMQSLFQYVSPPHPCSYLPDQLAQIQFELVAALSPSEYLQLMLAGWRRFGRTIFRPRCGDCRACQSLRIPAAAFRPNRSQRRCRKLNEAVVALRIGKPSVTRPKLDLYDRFHAHQTQVRDWPAHAPKNPTDYHDSFVDNPFPAEEWCYYLDDRLVGVGYVDVVPGGLSAIYFFREPSLSHRSLGTWNVLCLLDEARRRRLDHVYLGYYVAGCRSLEYKANFRPNEVLDSDGVWRPFRT